MSFAPLSTNADGKSWQAKPRQFEITCPVLAALYCNGDLQDDGKGRCNKAQIVTALQRLGFRDTRLIEALATTATQKGGYLDLYTMDGVREHGLSTGIRDNSKHGRSLPDQIQFDKLANLGVNDKLGPLELKRIEAFFSSPEGGGDVAEEQQVAPGAKEIMGRLFFCFLECFGRRDEQNHPYLLVDDLRSTSHVGT